MSAAQALRTALLIRATLLGLWTFGAMPAGAGEAPQGSGASQAATPVAAVRDGTPSQASALGAGARNAAAPDISASDAATSDAPGADEPGADASINPRYLLLDARGRMVSNEDFRGRFQLITFGYTSCPDVCPTTLAAMTQALHALGPLASRLQLVFISVDPERDTPAVLARYTAYFDPDILGLTGSPELVRASADHFKVRFRKYREPGANPQTYAVDHTSGMYLLGPDGEFIRKFADSLPGTRLSEELKALLREDSSRPREEPAR